LQGEQKGEITGSKKRILNNFTSTAKGKSLKMKCAATISGSNSQPKGRQIKGFFYNNNEKVLRGDANTARWL